MTDDQTSQQSDAPHDGLIIPADPDPSESPFAMPAIASMPYEKGGEEDRAIRLVIEEGERERRRAKGS